MGRIYSVEFEGVAVTAVQDFFALKPATDKPIKIHAIHLSQSSDVGDAAEEMLRVKIIRGASTIGSGGTNPTPRPLDSGDAACGITTNCRVNDTTKASGGTQLDMHSEAFNIRTGWVYLPTPEDRIRCSASDGFIVLSLMNAPNDELTMSGTLIFEEV